MLLFEVGLFEPDDIPNGPRRARRQEAASIRHSKSPSLSSVKKAQTAELIKRRTAQLVSGTEHCMLQQSPEGNEIYRRALTPHQPLNSIFDRHAHSFPNR